MTVLSFISGPLAGLFKFLGHELGVSIGKKITKDIRIAESEFKWTMKEKIAELKSDTYLSAGYLRDLIDHARTKKELMEIGKYLVNPKKAGNLNFETHASFVRSIRQKLLEIRDKETLQELIKAAQQKKLPGVVEQLEGKNVTGWIMERLEDLV